MSVRVRSLQGGPPPRTQFSDNFNRANGEPGSNWIRSLGGNDVNTLESWGTASIVANRFVMAGRGENNPNAVLWTSWLPVPVISALYNKPRVFVQATWIAAVGSASYVCLRYNNAAEAGPITNPNGCDAYIAGPDGQTARFLNGQTAAAVGVNAVPVVSGNVVRMTVENSGTSVILTSFINGAQVNQNTILAAAFPIPRGLPGFFLFLVSGAPPTGATATWDDFSCGVF